MSEIRNIPLSQDAALVVALAGTAIPFAHSAEDEAERWLRSLRLHGQVGAALQALGVGEAPLMTGAHPADEPAGTKPYGAIVVDKVCRQAKAFAGARGARTVGTADVLFAVLAAYGKHFDRALYLRGTEREELLGKLSTIERSTLGAGT
jgi:hypothetical protein